MSGQELAEFEVYIAELERSLGHADREAPFRGYTTGLLLPLERKSVEPMAARLDPARATAAHQSLHHFVAKAEWSDAALWSAVRVAVWPAIERCGPVEAWIVDDTGMPKKGRHSVGVARQYCGQLGKPETMRGCGDPAPHAVPGGGEPVGGERGGEPAGRLAALSAGRMGA
jgi:SRSO17 transposase